MRWTIEHGMTVRRVGEGPELVWIHGLGESSVSFEPIAAHPRFAGFTHVLVDLPGYGRSEWPSEPIGLGALADHLAAWLAERPPAIVIGHSMGGVLAVLLAERTKLRMIINIDGNISHGDCAFSGRAAAFSADDFIARGFAELRATVYADGVTRPAQRGYHAAMCFASPRMYHRHSSDLVALSIGETLAPRLPALKVPALFVAGVPDGVCAASRELLDRNGARWIGIEPAGHWVYLDRPDQFAAQVMGFIEAS